VAVQRSLTLLVVTCLAAPGIANGQTDLASVPLPAPPPPLRLFKDTFPESSSRSIESIKSSSWWEAPAGGNEIPRWAIGHTVAFNTAGGFGLSAGLFGRRADPLPLFLSQGATRGTQRAASNSVVDPEIYRLQWDATFGITAPLWNGPRLKINSIGEVFVPLSSSKPSQGTSRYKSYEPAFLKSPAFRFGIVSGF
jgi:hypothetical protein